ncbi:putative lipase [Legionella lansingensis]|uniref:Putative lipase n=1 Tax=Legionella lansingensis TaxID=45067 RepID=A0A0W0VUD7_9GAMM|nr:alpha/beta hydrolase [Legionella lansingensis]KTD23840.1 putative lipase [Legionella lansingensis]SNV46740.1 putative lipase [Legionella lansingensis]
MRSAFWKMLKDYQPVSTTGVLAHTYYWLTWLGSGDFVYKNPNFKPPETEDPSLKQGIVIYCVYGTADQPGSFARIASRLLAEGVPDYVSEIHLVAFDHRYQGKGIRYFSKKLIEKIKTNGHSHVIFMGHSRGGIIIADATEYRAAAEGIKVHGVVSICAPHGGSPLAIQPLSLFSTSVEEMQINSSFLARLNKKISQSENNYFFVAVEEDAIVPPEATFVEGYVEKHPESRLILNRHGHLSIMSSRRLVRHLGEKLFEFGATLFPQSKSDLNVTTVSGKEEIDEWIDITGDDSGEHLFEVALSPQNKSDLNGDDAIPEKAEIEGEWVDVTGDDDFAADRLPSMSK